MDIFLLSIAGYRGLPNFKAVKSALNNLAEACISILKDTG